MSLNLAKIKEVKFHFNPDERGCLTALEVGEHIPFEVKRMFFVHNVTEGSDRGGHAHRDTDQVLTCISDSMMVDISDGKEIYTYQLSSPAYGVFVPRMLWTRLYDFSPSSILCVIASTNYDKSRSIRTWEEYSSAVKSTSQYEPGAKGCLMPARKIDIGNS